MIKSITIKCPNMPMYLFSRNSIPKPKTYRITLSVDAQEGRWFVLKLHKFYNSNTLRYTSKFYNFSKFSQLFLHMNETLSALKLHHKCSCAWKRIVCFDKFCRSYSHWHWKKKFILCCCSEIKTLWGICFTIFFCSWLIFSLGTTC